MKKQITAGIALVASSALCAAVWPRSAEVESLPAEPVKTAVSKHSITEITTGKETEKPALTQTA